MSTGLVSKYYIRHGMTRMHNSQIIRPNAKALRSKRKKYILMCMGHSRASLIFTALGLCHLINAHEDKIIEWAAELMKLLIDISLTIGLTINAAIS